MVRKRNASPPPSSEPAAQESQLPVKYDYGQHQGKNFEGTSQADFALPFLGVIQSNSPEVIQNKPKYDDKTKPGMLINSVTREIIDGVKGVYFIPCATQHVFVEFRPRAQGGGFQGVHPVDSDIVTTAKNASKEFGDYKTDEGNELTETFYVFGIRLAAPDSTEGVEAVCVAFTSTKIKVYKRFMQVLRSYKGKPPLFAHRLLLRSVPDKNAQGDFFNFAVGPAIDDSTAKSLLPPVLEDGKTPNPLLEECAALSEQIAQGARGADHAAGAASGESSGANADKLF